MKINWEEITAEAARKFQCDQRAEREAAWARIFDADPQTYHQLRMMDKLFRSIIPNHDEQ